MRVDPLRFAVLLPAVLADQALHQGCLLLAALIMASGGPR